MSNERLKIILLIFLFKGIILSPWSDTDAGNCLDVIKTDNTRNMMVNSGFEEIPDFNGWSTLTNPAGVTTIIDSMNSNNGDVSVKVTWDGSSEKQNYYHTYQTLDVMPGRTYRLNGYIKTEDIFCVNSDVARWNGIRILVYDPDNPYGSELYWSSSTESLYGTNDWTKVSTEFTVPDYSSRVRIMLRRFVGWQSGPSYGTAWWDDIQLLPVPVIYDMNVASDMITIHGESFGVDPGAGNRNSDENCVLYEGMCLPESQVLSWSDSVIVIDNIGTGTISVKSGGIVSNPIVEQNDVTLSNNTISIYFPNTVIGDGIEFITDADTGRQFIDESAGIQPLYEFVVKENLGNTAKTTISSRDASFITKHYSVENGSGILSITANHCDEFMVTATIRLPLDQGGARFSIDIQNTANRIVQSAHYPLIAAKSMLGNYGTDDAIVIPYAEGYLLKEPWRVYDMSNYRSIDYPGSMTLQMMAYYDTEETGDGLYLSMDDTEGYKKHFGFDRINDGTWDYVLFSFNHITSESPGNNLSIPYNVIVDTFAGDWRDAADKYKEWVIQPGIPWTSAKLTERTDVPEWLYEVKTMIDCYRCLPEDYVALVNKYEELLGVSDILIYPGGFWGYNDGYCTDTDGDGINDADPVAWSGIDYFTDDPVYDISEEINPPYTALRNVISELRAQNSDVLLFIEGLYWDHYFFKRDNNGMCPDTSLPVPESLICFDDRPDYDLYDADYVIKNEDGSDKYTTTYGLSQSDRDKYCRLSSVMCSGNETDNVTDLVILNNIKRGIDHGVRLMALDGIISGHIHGCWNPYHGHPVGEGKWIHDRFVSILNDIRDIINEKGMYGNFGLSMEVPHELYLQLLPTQYMRNSGLSSESSQSIPLKKIPLFNYIYKEYFLSTDRGRYFSGGNDPLSRWAVAMDFIQGHVQGTMINFDPDYEPNAYITAFYKRLINMKRTEFYKASILHPPVFNGLPGESTLTVGDKNYIADIVLTNVLKTDDNTISYLLVNTNTDGSGIYPVQFNAEQYDLPTNKVNVKIIKNGIEVENDQNAGLPYNVNVDLDGGDVVEVRVEHWDFDGDGLNNDDEVQIGTDPYNPDTDGDNLNDGDEIKHSTNPLHPDTDRDKIIDGSEVDQGYDPLDIFSPNPEGWNLSRNSDFSTSDTIFSTNNTLYILVWTNRVDPDNLKKDEYKFKSPYVVIKDDLIPDAYTFTHSASVSMQTLSPSQYRFEFLVKDGMRNTYREKDIYIDVQ